MEFFRERARPARRPGRSFRGRTLAIAAHAVLGACCGSLLGIAFERAMQWRAARAGVADYAQNLSRHADELFEELHPIFQHSVPAPFPFCSDEDLAALRAQTFRSRDLKDVGRTRDGKLYCSALLGRLAQPSAEIPPTLRLADGTLVYSNIAIILAASSGSRGTVLESGDTDVVLSPEAFDHWSRPKVGYLIAVSNPSTGQFAAIAGAGSYADPQWSARSGFRTVADVLSYSRCSEKHPICAMTAERLADVWAGSRATEAACGAMGALAGLGLGLALALAFLRTEGLRHQLTRALRRDSSSLRIVYEPILDLSSGRCTGAEALTRWQDHDGVPIAPEVFIRLAEDSGFIGLLTAWVLRRSMGELGPLLRQHPSFTLSINVAASDINGEALAEVLEECVRRERVHPSQIVLELTERSTADLELFCQSVAHLASLGYQVHIDDFGTGYSSLSYLHRLAVHAIKVDRSFTRTIGTEAVTVSILPQMLAMAKTLNLDVIVEGVETEAQLRYLDSTHQPLRVQGWYFSRPMSAGELAFFLERSEARAAEEEAILFR